jgi:chemotaxis regulatin CheY-phosphate phosphatase CheZ
LQSIYRALEAVDAHFQTLVDEACEHQEAWDALMRKKAEAEDLERRVRETIILLKEGKDELEEAVREGRKVREGIEKAANGNSTPTASLKAARRRSS